MSQITEILRDQRMYTEEEIKAALDEYGSKNPVKKKVKRDELNQTARDRYT